MRKRVELTLEALFPPDPVEMAAAAAELESQLDREAWAVVEALAVAILAQESRLAAKLWEAHRSQMND